MGKGEDVCSVNAAGANNKYMVSTYSTPEQVASPQGNGGVYTCSGGSAGGAYAQCDGGCASRAPRRRPSPVSTSPCQREVIVLLITTASSTGGQSYQILGPYPCDKSFFKYCRNETANTRTGSTICRRPVRHGFGADRAAHRQGGSPVQRVRVGVNGAPI